MHLAFVIGFFASVWDLRQKKPQNDDLFPSLKRAPKVFTIDSHVMPIPQKSKHTMAPLSLSLSLSRLFLCLGYGYKGVRWKENNIIHTCVSVVYWAMWYSRNDSVFLFVDTFLNYTSDKIRDLFFRRRGRDTVTQDAYQVFKTMTMEISVKNGWRFSNRLCL